ncbi:MAG TPA: hypothetical protein VLX92_08570, partial [Kofleriaceae bacterium]|nr:hypothetical protein [Kofleriaceae bacterium]
ACARAFEAARALPDADAAREQRAEARLRQVRAAGAPADRARHLDAALELALALPRGRAGAQLARFALDLLDDAARGRPAARRELERVAAALSAVGAGELGELVRSAP